MGTAAAYWLEPADAPLPDFGPPALAEDELVARALARRGDVAARERVGAEADAALAGSQAIPDVALSAAYGRDAIDRANTLLFGLAIPIPVFNRNQGVRLKDYRSPSTLHGIRHRGDEARPSFGTPPTTPMRG